MSKHYTDEDVRAAHDAVRSGAHVTTDAAIRAVLDAVAPAIAARALREAAVAYGEARWTGKFPSSVQYLNAETWLLDRANGIEAAS